MSNKRRRLTGVVTRTNMPKTIMVEVLRDYRHPLYEKVIRSGDKYLVHDEIGCTLGDEVIIVESRPISKRKRWAVQEIVHKVTEVEARAEREEIVDESAALELEGEEERAGAEAQVAAEEEPAVETEAAAPEAERPDEEAEAEE